MTKCYMLGSMPSILQQKYHGTDLATNMMFNIDEMFSSFGC